MRTLGRPRITKDKAGERHRQVPPRRSRLPELQLGAHVRRLRRERGLTLQAVSSSTRLSPALLSLIENEQVIPPIATLLKIARFFNIPLSRFFEDHETGAVSVVRRHERLPVNRRLARDGQAIGYRYFSLGYHKAHKRMEPFLVEFDSKEKEDVLYFDHQGEEFLYVLAGRLEFRSPNRTEVLGPGDALMFDSTLPHGFRAVGSRTARAVVTVVDRP